MRNRAERKGNCRRCSSKKKHTGIDGLVDGSSGKRRRHVNDGGLSINGVLSSLYGLKDGEAQVLLSSLTRRNSTDQVGSIVQSLLTVESSLKRKSKFGALRCVFVCNKVKTLVDHKQPKRSVLS